MDLLTVVRVDSGHWWPASRPSEFAQLLPGKPRQPVTAAQRPAERTARSGTFGSGMEYLCWGSGPKTLLFIQGGPGSAVPRG